MEDGASIDSQGTPQDSDTREDQTLRRAKRSPNKSKKRQNKNKRCRGNDYDEVMALSRGKDDSIEKKKKGKYLRLRPSLDDNDGGSKESKGKPSMKEKMINTEIPSLELEKNNLKRGRTPSVPHEEELFYLSDKFWGDVNKDHEMNQQFTRHSSTSSSIRPYESLDPDKCFVGELGLALKAITRNQSNPVQVALEQFKLLSQSLNIRKNYTNQTLEARITSKKEELYELEEQKIAMSYLDTKIKHGRLVLDAYDASHGFETDCGFKEDTPKAMNEGNFPQATIACRKPITGKALNTSPHSQEKRKKKKRMIENKENCYHSSIPSNAVASSEEINERSTSSQIRSLQDGMTVEVLVKGKSDGKVALPGKKVKIYFTAKLKETGLDVGSHVSGSPEKIRIGHKKVLKGLNIGIEGMHVGEKRRLTIPPSLGLGSKAEPPILPDSWLQYDVELVDICKRR
ncbi:hypothetical protein RND71_019224 [Anisodus tanguticus]|uniref:peptidylprolyl isomerase n=1 Tax=Anisodus tanguticus TaxID=243964 RepID=A0AAE1S044_9SOLA|nr:hypothetical protein RND71_019224 [Anisodus tanguticus]